MAQSAKTSQELLSRLGKDESSINISHFPTRVPDDFIKRINALDDQDPLILQVLPTAAELHETSAYTTDPLAELSSCQLPGLMEKYATRVLVTLTGACAIHCRYCFRRHFPYGDHLMKPQRWANILDRLREQEDIKEVIFSGGDPLTLSDDILEKYALDLANIPHLRRLRIHTRVPVVIPSRVDGKLLNWLRQNPLKIVMVLHINHANELDEEFANASQQLRTSGISLFNQSVLLAGVNDNAEVLAELSEGLFELGIIPYYLHLLDKVQGAAHFDVPREKAARLYQELKTLLPGYLVPRMVREQAAAAYKQDIFEL